MPDISNISEGSNAAVQDAVQRLGDSGHKSEGVAIYWHQCLGNKFAISPHVEMLKPNGQLRLRWVSLHGESKHKIDRPPARWIIYNEDYIVAWLANTLGDIFNAVDRARFLRMYSAAKARAKG